MILAAVVFILLLSTLASAAITMLSHGFARKKQTQFARLLERQLPGKNCGACGFSDCRMFAEGVLFDDISAEQCPFCDEAQALTVRKLSREYHELTENRDPAPRKKRGLFRSS